MSDILWLLSLIAVVLLCDYGAVLLVRAEERQRDREDEARRLARVAVRGFPGQR